MAKKANASRRDFITKAMAGAGATAVTAIGTSKIARADSADNRQIKIPDEFTTPDKVSRPKIDFPMTGAQVFARVCKEEGLAALFCCPGNYNVVNAIALEGIPTYSGRHEGAMCHAADAFIRVTGE
ncbi:MAG TPA: thiamine pyrophosphate-binding protein, partial [Blastocatellia bacterium]|nr:thiamine pyrophosphate-binding protein [Blastocatellia bacterium]